LPDRQDWHQASDSVSNGPFESVALAKPTWQLPSCRCEEPNTHGAEYWATKQSLWKVWRLPRFAGNDKGIEDEERKREG
jgi:hypothetical protein